MQVYQKEIYEIQFIIYNRQYSACNIQHMVSLKEILSFKPTYMHGQIDNI